MTQSGNVDKLWELIQGIEFAMLTTHDGNLLRARPMATAQKAFTGDLWFFTRANAPKVDEVWTDQQVNVSYSDTHKNHYVSVSGRASLVRDKATITQHWNPIMKAWFPKGIDDPEVALLKVHVEQAEYWDTPSSTMVNVFGYVKAAITGRSPHPGEVGKVTMV